MQGHDQNLGECVACETLQEDGRLVCRCQGLTCDRRDQGRRHVDLVPVVFPSDKMGWRTQEMFVQAGLKPFGHCWIEQVMRGKYVESTKELKGDSKERTEGKKLWWFREFR